MCNVNNCSIKLASRGEKLIHGLSYGCALTCFLFFLFFLFSFRLIYFLVFRVFFHFIYLSNFFFFFWGGGRGGFCWPDSCFSFFYYLGWFWGDFYGLFAFFPLFLFEVRFLRVLFVFLFFFLFEVDFLFYGHFFTFFLCFHLVPLFLFEREGRWVLLSLFVFPLFLFGLFFICIWGVFFANLFCFTFVFICVIFFIFISGVFFVGLVIFSMFFICFVLYSLSPCAF